MYTNTCIRKFVKLQTQPKVIFKFVFKSLCFENEKNLLIENKSCWYKVSLNVSNFYFNWRNKKIQEKVFISSIATPYK